VRVNQPVERGALSILAQNIGVSPLMVLKDAAGSEIAGSFFSLNVLRGDEDSFSFPEVPYSFFVRFYPDFAEDKGEYISRSKALNNPVMHVIVKKGEQKVREGLLSIRQSMAFDGLSISFEDVRYWVEFYVVREYGSYTLSAGFLIGVVGLIMRLLFYQKSLRIFVEEQTGGARVYIDGKSEYYPYSFRDELDVVAEELRALFLPVVLPGPGAVEE